MNALGGGYARILMGALVVLLGAYSGALAAETPEARLQRLEKEVKELRRILGERQQNLPGRSAAEAVTGSAVAATEPAGVFIRYYLSDKAFAQQPPKGVSPAAAGRFTLPEVLSFDPKKYDMPDEGFFSRYGDPVAYRHVALLVEGDMTVRETGDYEFVLYPKPVREGGSSVATRMTAYLRMDDRPVVSVANRSSWRPQRGRIHLQAGTHRLWLWALVASDGFGPSPTESHLRVGLKAPGDASVRALQDLRPLEY